MVANARADAAVVVWRHPKPIGAAGRCIGHTDLPVDPRKAKRLAHRIRRYARVQRVWQSLGVTRPDGTRPDMTRPEMTHTQPRQPAATQSNPQRAPARPLAQCQVYTSPLRRSADVGRWLRRWGWRHHIDAALIEIDFGAWDGATWAQIGEPAVTAWCADFAHYAGHGGETLAALFERCSAWAAAAPTPAVRCVVGHAGWINAAQFVSAGQPLPRNASEWPAAVKFGQRLAVF